MKKLFFILRNKAEAAGMAYCAINDLYAAYGEGRVAGWSRLNPDTADRAITDIPKSSISSSNFPGAAKNFRHLP